MEVKGGCSRGVFRHRINPEFQGEFDVLYGQMVSVVSGLPGYQGHKVFAADDGECVLIGYFADFAAIETWDRHPEHRRAKARGKNDVFLECEVIVAEVVERHRKSMSRETG